MNLFVVSEDEAVIAQVADFLEGQSDLKMIGASITGRDGIAHISKLIPDVVLIDVNLIDMHPIEVSRQIKSIKPTIKVLMMSVATDSDWMRKAMQAGVLYFLGKPLDKYEVIDTFRYMKPDVFVTMLPELRTITGSLQTRFADRLLAVYVIGSHADGTAGSGSDLDLMLIFRGQASADEKAEVERFLAELAEPMAVSLDLELLDEAAARASTDPILKLGSTFLFGEDIRDSLTLMPIDEWARDRLHTSYWRTIHLFGRPAHVKLPLNYPLPDDEFLGYVVEDSTRTLIRHVSWAATGLIAYLGGKYVVRKSEFAATYQTAVGDEFAPFLHNLYRRCKVEWDYQIPADRAALRDLCRQTRMFENHFLAIYCNFLEGELWYGSVDARDKALSLLNKIPFDDPRIQSAKDNSDSPSSALK